MKISNELKVGLTIITATVVFILGVRYFEDLPLFKSTYSLAAEFDNAGGLIAGNVVRVNGVTVGSVDDVSISSVTGKVNVLFHVGRNIPVTEGTYGVVTGFDALGALRLDLYLGDPTGSPIEEGGLIEGNPGSDLMSDLSSRAPEMIDKVDSVLSGLDSMLSETNSLISEPDSDIRKTLSSVEGSVAELEILLTSERERIGRILENVEAATSSLNSATGEDGAAISDLVENLNGVLATLDVELEGLGEVSDGLNTLLQKLNDGDGTLGMLINDPSMYQKMDSTLDSINQLLQDFQNDPGKYLGEMKLVDLFLSSTMPSYKDALELFHEWTKSDSLRRHGYAVEAAMGFYARLFGEDEEKWRITGLLHDMDYEKHPTPEEHPFVGIKVLREEGYPEDVLTAILGHAEYSGTKRESRLSKTLFAVDELAGFITAVGYVRPTGLEGMKPKSVNKKLKDKAFAAAVSREDIRNGAEDMVVELSQHIANVIEGMLADATRLGFSSSE